MSETFYVKKGRKYIPVSYLHDGLLDALPKGCHLVVVMDGSTAYRMQIAPAFAGTLGALTEIRDDMAKVISEAINCRPNVNRELTKTELKHWRALEKLFGTHFAVICPSVQHVIDEIEKALKKRVTEVTP